MSGPYPEDDHTSTVDAAAAYEDVRAQHDDDLLADADEHQVDPADEDDYYDDLEYEFDDYADDEEDYE